MKEKTDKLVTWVALGIAILASVFAIIFALDITNEGMFNVAYWIIFLFVILAVLGMLGCMLGSFFYRLIKNFKENPTEAIKTIIVIGIAIVVCIVAFLLASGNDVSKALLDKNGLTEAASKWIGTACIMVYTLVFGAIAAIIYVECAKMFKK